MGAGRRAVPCRRGSAAAAVLLGHDDDDEALPLLAAARRAADEVERAGARQVHGGVARLVGGDGAGRAAAVVVVQGHLQHRVRRAVELEHKVVAGVESVGRRPFIECVRLRRHLPSVDAGNDEVLGVRANHENEDQRNTQENSTRRH